MNFAVLNFPDPLYLNYVRTLTRLFKGGFPGHLMKEVSIYYSRCYGDKGKGRRESSAKRVINCHWINEEGYERY